MKLACAVTEFGLVLKDSDYKGSANLEKALKYAMSVNDPDEYEKELVTLIEKYKKADDKYQKELRRRSEIMSTMSD